MTFLLLIILINILLSVFKYQYEKWNTVPIGSYCISLPVISNCLATTGTNLGIILFTSNISNNNNKILVIAGSLRHSEYVLLIYSLRQVYKVQTLNWHINSINTSMIAPPSNWSLMLQQLILSKC